MWTVHDGVLAQSGLRDSALHELYGCMYALRTLHSEANLQICMPSNIMCVPVVLLESPNVLGILFLLCSIRIGTMPMDKTLPYV